MKSENATEAKSATGEQGAPAGNMAGKLGLIRFEYREKRKARAHPKHAYETYLPLSVQVIGQRSNESGHESLTLKPLPFSEGYAWLARDVFHSLPGASPCIHATWAISSCHDASLVSG